MVPDDSKKISMIEVFALSIATVAPTGAMAFNTTTAASVAGVNIPISFLIGALALLLVGLCFAQLSRQIANEGSVYAYNREALGERAGFMTGWALTLTYICFSAGTAGLTADFGSTFLSHFGLHVAPSFLGIVFTLLVWFIMFFGLKLTSRIALVAEIISVCIVMFLSVVILLKTPLSAKPFIEHHNTVGVGQGMVYAILCFAGFEGSSTVAVRAREPKKAVPRAILITIIGAAIFYVFVSYAQVIGFGVAHVKNLATASAPLNTLAVTYLGNGMATVIDLATLMSCFAAYLGSLNACAFMFFALSNQGYLPRGLGKFDVKLNSPKNAVNTVAVICLILYALIGIPFGPEQLYASLATIGALSLLIVYMLVCVGTFFYFHRSTTLHFSIWQHAILPAVGLLILVFPLWSNLYPVPKYPMNLYPYVVIVWLLVGVLMGLHHTIKAKPTTRGLANWGK